MKIVVLDGYTTNPGDLSWSKIEALGPTEIYDRTPCEEIVRRCSDAEAIMTNDVHLTEAVMTALPQLKYIGVLATGYNVVDIEAAKKRGICVTNVPAYSTPSVAQTTFALLLELCHRTGSHSDAVHEGAWSRSLDYCFWNYPLIELQGKVIGIIGYGRIGQAVATMARAFGMKVVASSSRTDRVSSSAEVEFLSLQQLLETSDVVSVHCPLTEKTEGMINKTTLGWMKPGALFLNVSRGKIVVEEDLAAALKTGHIAGAGLDVLSTEPPSPENPMLGIPNCIITPHIAWAPRESRERLVAVAAKNLESYLSGSPINVVSV